MLAHFESFELLYAKGPRTVLDKENTHLLRKTSANKELEMEKKQKLSAVKIIMC